MASRCRADSAGLKDQSKLNGDSDYTIMFGPDICGSTKKVHVIFNYKGKNLLIKKTIPAETDQMTHVYTLIVNPDNTYEVRIDGTKKEGGNLADDFDFLLFRFRVFLHFPLSPELLPTLEIKQKRGEMKQKGAK